MTDTEIVDEVKRNHPQVTQARVINEHPGLCGVCERPHGDGPFYCLAGHTTVSIIRLCASCEEED